MIKRKRTNKKGNWFVENLGEIVLTAIGIGIGIYFLWAYVLHGGGDSIHTLQQCGSLTGNKGQCKETCDTSIELELPNIGCSGVANKCCILKDDNMNDVILPTGYGQSDKYDFSITLMNMDVPKGCKMDTATSMKCVQGNELTTTITITVSNTGAETVTVKADPVIVLNDNGDNVREGNYLGKPVDIKTKTDAKLTTDIKISSDEAKANTYWNIYPYALCDTQVCKDADTSSRGIYRKDATNSMVLTIKFVNPSQI